MSKIYTRSIELFRVTDLYGHHLIGLATLVYDLDHAIGSGPSALTVRVLIDGNIEDELTFNMDWSHLDPRNVDSEEKQLELPLSSEVQVGLDESLLSPRALDAGSPDGH